MLVYIDDVRANKRRGVVEIIADGQLLMRVRGVDFGKIPVRAGDELDETEYAARVADLQINAVYESALNALDRSAKTERELRRLLALKGFMPRAIDTAIDRLKRARLIDDGALAARLTESAEGAQMGIYSIKRKLKTRGISDADAENALEAVGEDAQISACRAHAIKLERRYADLPERERVSKLKQALARRGFTWDVIDAALPASEDYDT